MAKVNVQVGFTKNIGNFNSVRYDVGYERDLEPQETLGEAEDEIYAYLELFVSKRVNKIEKEVKEIEDGKKG